jgi:hypothetical protein
MRFQGADVEYLLIWHLNDEIAVWYSSKNPSLSWAIVCRHRFGIIGKGCAFGIQKAAAGFQDWLSPEKRKESIHPM